MSKKQWFILLCLLILYLLLGACIFYHIESKQETLRRNEERKERLQIEELLKTHYTGATHFKEEIFARVSEYCGKPLTIEISKHEEPRKWDFYHSLFFVITVVSTIGYGNLAPTTMFGRIFMIFYALIGIPMNGIVMVTLGEFFGNSFTKLYDRWKTAKIQYTTARVGLIGQIVLYLVPGFTFFIFLPAVFMMIFEGWAYDVAVYYCFVTLTTIGFGDYVAGVQNVYKFGETTHTIYKIFLLVWVIGGIGYVVMVLGFISRGMRSKHVKEIEHIISENLRKTPQRIRNDLRQLLNEFLFMKIKPIYKEELYYIPVIRQRSQSCPELTMYRSTSPMLRKRAFSECPSRNILDKVQSDTQLEKIDKEMTFKPADAFRRQKDLLLKVVDALSSAPIVQKEEGINCFSDEEILASEKLESDWPKKVSPPYSPKLINNKFDNVFIDHTWYGNEALKASDDFRKRRNTLTVQNEIPSRYTNPQNFVKNIDIEKQNLRKNLDDVQKGFISNNILTSTINEHENDHTWSGTEAIRASEELKKRRRTLAGQGETSPPSNVPNIVKKLRKTLQSKISKDVDVEQQFQDVQQTQQSNRRRQSTMPTYNDDSVLEHTTIADFLRALTDLATTEQDIVCPPSSPLLRRNLESSNFRHRHGSLMYPNKLPKPIGRRFSLRPVEDFVPLSNTSRTTFTRA